MLELNLFTLKKLFIRLVAFPRQNNFREKNFLKKSAKLTNRPYSLVYIKTYLLIFFMERSILGNQVIRIQSSGRLALCLPKQKCQQ